jgi:hypothetical protein
MPKPAIGIAAINDVTFKDKLWRRCFIVTESNKGSEALLQPPMMWIQKETTFSTAMVSWKFLP